MKQITPLAEHLTPDTISQLERAAELRHDDGLSLLHVKRNLAAVYLFGYSAEMCLAAAYFRAVGFAAKRVIERDERLRHMARAKNLKDADGNPLMNSDPHPLVGWARFLKWQHTGSKISAAEMRRLNDAIGHAEMLYKHWRPELRYKLVEVTAPQLAEVSKASTWFLEHRGRL